MISVEELKGIRRLKGLKSLGQAEKDYLIELGLLSLSRSTKDELVFKGGTCLYKFYGLDRFSEDLDFTVRRKLDCEGAIRRMAPDMSAFGVEAEIRGLKKTRGTVSAAIKAKGPLYEGTPRSVCGIRVEMNIESVARLKPERKTLDSMYSNIPRFSILCMPEREVLAEKVRAIMTRAKARDVYDLGFLLGKGVPFKEGLVKGKLEYYGREWSLEKFEDALRLKEGLWKPELGPLLGRVPDFGKTKRIILKELGG